MEKTYDLIIIGGGPSGLAAAINATSEGLDTVLIDCHDNLGGQASASTRVENYPGFPEGISGAELMAKFIRQADRFGTKVIAPVRATGLQRDDDGVITVTTDDPEYRRIRARAVVLAVGLRYNRLSAKGVSAYLGRGVYYGRVPQELPQEGRTLCTVGGANSAGQAALNFASRGCRVHMFVREQSLSAGMSKYLVERIESEGRITVHTGTVVAEVTGDEQMRAVRIEPNGGGASATIEAHGICITIGATPKTYWLNGLVETTPRKGYLCTGMLAGAKELTRLPFETSMPGVFACGDVREGSTKRIASGVGEGSVVVQEVKQYLERAKT